MFIFDTFKNILFKNEIIDLNIYSNVLVNVPDKFISKDKLTFDINIFTDIKKIILSIKNFIENNYNLNINNTVDNNIKLIISLSGGVDSMVLSSILNSDYLIKELKKYNINLNSILLIAIHINYNNREETQDEQKFIEDWCKINNIKLYTKIINEVKRGEINRADYEKITRDIRYNFYKEILHLENLDSIIFGHHKDDIIENIFANMCRGRSLLNLASMSSEAIINDVKIFRPMLEINKNFIYKLAYNQNIPYFKDSTPNWSVRGKFRQEIYPLLINTFGEQLDQNLLLLNEQSQNLNDVIDNEIIKNFINKVSFNCHIKNLNENEKIQHSYNIKFNSEEYKSFNITFWLIIFQKLFHKFSKPIPSRKAMQSFIKAINSNKIGFISISNLCVCKIINNVIYIKFKEY